MQQNIRLGDVLLGQNAITSDQLNKALEYQKAHTGLRLGACLIQLGFISENQLLKALSVRLNMPLVDPDNLNLQSETVRLIPQTLAEKYHIVAVKNEPAVLSIITDDPLNYYAIEDIRSLVGKNIQVGICDTHSIQSLINRYYAEVNAHRAADMANKENADIEEITIDDIGDDAPIIQLLDSLVQQGYQAQASDIHIEPFEKKVFVRMRTDGVMNDFVTLNKSVINPLITRIKIVSNLDIAEKRIPQDGHFQSKVGNETVNIRVSVLPTVYGEKCVLRLLGNHVNIDYSDTYGMKEENYRKVRQMIDSPYGIIYLTGPTGSGKTTTLYMILNSLAKNSVNISTIEDPVERNIPRINQVQVNALSGLTFESGLRALLRQDPDIIMVGETRDADTAETSVRAAITGHLVFSTLHTNNASDSIVRLENMGVEPYLLASSLTGVIAQRLVRKVCPHCSKYEEPTAQEKFLLPSDVLKVKHAQGCNYCKGTGYSGRVAIHEVLFVDTNIRRMISERKLSQDIEKYAVEHQNMHLLKDEALQLVKDGITTVDEYKKVSFFG